jgi:hypothetical protein
LKVELYDFNSCKSFGTVILTGVPRVEDTINVLERASGYVKSYLVRNVTFLYDEYQPEEPARLQVYVVERHCTH